MQLKSAWRTWEGNPDRAWSFAMDQYLYTHHLQILRDWKGESAQRIFDTEKGQGLQLKEKNCICNLVF
jgi:hypothetical protein